MHGRSRCTPVTAHSNDCLQRSGHTRLSGAVVIALLAADLAVAAPADEIIDEVLVTGSHIVRPLDDATGPTAIVAQEDFERRPAQSLGETLQRLPMQTGYTENANDNFGDGATRINLRGLGAERTLVLLNGRRFVFGGLGADASVDIDSIPLSLVERVEVSANGASAVYGADAVSGVVNVITRKDFSGVEFSGGYAISEHGDGDSSSARIVFGHNFARGNLSAGVEHAEQSVVGQSARSYSAHVESLAGPDGPVVRTGLFTSAEGIFDIPPDNAIGVPVPEPTFFTRVTGSGAQDASAYRVFDPVTDLFDYASYLYLQTPVERTAAWLSGNYALAEGIDAYVELLAQRRDSSQGRPSATYHNFIRGAAPYDPVTGRQVIPATNYYNPFAADVIGLFRAFVESGGRSFSQQSDAYRLSTGLSRALDRGTWQVSLTWGRNESTSSR